MFFLPGAISIMFIVLLDISFMVPSSRADFSHTNGRPSCVKPHEFERVWRNNFDPTKYWRCYKIGLAVSIECQLQYLYLDSRQGCVHFTQWKWEPPYDPISDLRRHSI